MHSFNDLKKNLKKNLTDCKKIKLAIIADNASQLINTAIKGYGYEVCIDFEVFEAEYNQIDLIIHSTNSELYEFEPDIVFINYSTEHLLKDFYKKNIEEQKNYASSFNKNIEVLIQVLSSNSKSKIIINTLPEINDSIFGNFAAKTNHSFVYQLRKLNFLLAEQAQQNDKMFLLDVAMLQSQYGRNELFDAKMYLSGDFVYSLDFLPKLAKNFCDIVLAITGVFKKCLILDLDNTLWGGIIGDDGINGIQIGELGVGKAFTEFQLWIKQLKQRGIILGVCSKNTEEIAKEPFEQNTDMVLKLDDIAIFVANWETKVDNIRYIQQTLNIGMDSMVFVDDNPFEREMVKSGIQEITVPEMPEDPAEYISYLRTLNLFETATVTEEDGDRTKQYQEESKRNTFLKSFQNEDEFLQNLEMFAESKAFDSFTSPRVAQLSQRSNQFNLRTVRYTETDIVKISSSNKFATFTFSLKDKFGNHGLIGAIVLEKKDDETLFIDTLIMSCRVLKRTMENFMLNKIVSFALENNFKKIIGEYIPTKKNGIVANLYKDLGFTEDNGNWIQNIISYQIKKSHITEINNGN